MYLFECDSILNITDLGGHFDVTN